MQGPHPAKVAAAPFHGFGPGKFAHQFGDDLRHGLSGGKAALFNNGNVKAALFGFLNLALLNAIQPGTAQKPGQSLFWRSNAGAFAFFAHIGGLIGQVINHGGQATRPGKAAYRAKCKAKLF